MKLLKKLFKKNYLFCLLILFQLGLSLFWAWVLPFNQSPDECLHFKTAEFFFLHRRLPVARQEEITFIKEPDCLGTTYITTPFLNYILAALSIPIGNNLGIERPYLAARMSSVLFGILFTIFFYKFLKEIFGSRNLLIFSTLFVTIMIPQVMFTFSSLNIESYSLAASAFLLFSSVHFFKLPKKKLNKLKSYLLLGFAISFQLFAKYNFYLLLLVPILLLLVKIIKEKIFPIKNLLLLLGLVISLSGWFFVRNQILYQDFLGLRTYREITREKMIGRSYAQAGWNFYDILFKSPWLLETASSFYGRFGYMNITIDPVMQWIFRFFVFLGLVGLIKRLIEFKKISVLTRGGGLYLLFLGLIPFNIMISLWNSLYFDFQNQGRYLFPILIPLMVLVNKGVFALAGDKKSKLSLAIGIIIGSILLNFWSFLYLPKI